MKPSAVLLVVLVLVLVAALYSVASLEGTPSETSTSTTLLGIGTTTQFNYEATLRPNLLYNQTTLGPGQGALYTSLVLTLNLSFTYWLNLSAPANVTFGGGYGLVLASPSQWNYSLNHSLGGTPEEFNVSSVSFHDSTVVNISRVLALLAVFENETQASSSGYELYFTALEVATINYGGSRTQSVTTPVLNVSIGGGLITPGLLSSSSNGSIPTTLEVANTTRTTDLEYASAICLILAGCAAIAAYLTFTERRTKKPLAEDLRSMTAPYADAIANTWTAPRKENVIVVRDWDDLVHVADMLGKPILRYVLRTRTPQRYFFYVLDGGAQYIYLVPEKGRIPEEDLADLT